MYVREVKRAVASEAVHEVRGAQPVTRTLPLKTYDTRDSEEEDHRIV